MTLYVDGKRVGHNGGHDVGPAVLRLLAHRWRQPVDGRQRPYFNGDIDDVAIYPTALTAAQVQAALHRQRRTVDVPPTPTDAYGKAVYDSNPDLYWRLGESTGTTAKDATQNESDGIYPAA